MVSTRDRDGGGKGARTRAKILTVALQLFTQDGYERTSTQDIADALGLTKPALYYHFRNKEDIVFSLVTKRKNELDDFIVWLNSEPYVHGRLESAAVRWVSGTTPERLQAMQLAHANLPLMRRMEATGGNLRSLFAPVIDYFAVIAPTPPDRLIVRMCFDTAGAALLAAERTQSTLDEVIAAAITTSRDLAHALETRTIEKAPLG